MKKLSSKDKTLHAQFSIYGRNVKEWMSKCVMLLPQIEKNEIWAKKGFTDIYEYARKIAGMSRNKVNESLRILSKTESLPEIRKLIETKGVFAVKPIVNIVTPETEQFWATRISEMRKSTLETFVKDYKAEHPKLQVTDDTHGNFYGDQIGRPGAGSPTDNGFNKPNLFGENVGINEENSDSRIQVSMKIEPEIIEALRQIKGYGDWNDVMRKLLKSYQSQVEAEEKEFQEELGREKPEVTKSKNHKAPTAIKNFILKRSKGLCEHPNCTKHGKHIHHTEPFALKKVHDPDKLIHLCEEHHQIVHLGYIDDSNIEQSPQLSWHQIEKLPSYDLKNIINQQIATFQKLHH